MKNIKIKKLFYVTQFIQIITGNRSISRLIRINNTKISLHFIPFITDFHDLYLYLLCTFVKTCDYV